MNYNSQNQDLLRKIYVHDSYFTGFCYDHCKGELRFSCENDYEKKVTYFAFLHVIYMDLQCCDLWHGDNRILGFDLIKNKSKLRALKKKKEALEASQPKPDPQVLEQARELLEKYPELRGMCDEAAKKGLRDDIDYVEIAFQLSSGDTLRVICESISVEGQENECGIDGATRKPE